MKANKNSLVFIVKCYKITSHIPTKRVSYMDKLKKPLLIAALVLDVGITIFLFVISILILAKVIPAATLNEAINNSQGLIRYLLKNPTVYLVAFVIPLFVLLAGNVVGLILYVRKTSAKAAPAQLDDLTPEQKEALRQELLKDLGAPKEEEK